ncbi:hypothetical protein QTP70_012103, partial [Hemibagrus guttatus]
RSTCSCSLMENLAGGGTDIRNRSFWYGVACLVEDYG